MILPNIFAQRFANPYMGMQQFNMQGPMTSPQFNWRPAQSMQPQAPQGVPAPQMPQQIAPMNFLRARYGAV